MPSSIVSATSGLQSAQLAEWAPRRTLIALRDQAPQTGKGVKMCLLLSQDHLNFR